MFAGRHCAHLCPPIYPWSARHICISKMQEGCFFRNTDCVWELNQREKDAALFAFTGSRNPYAVWSNLGLCHSTFSDTSIFLLFVFNPTRKHHEIVCQNPLKCLHEVICDQTIVVVAILSWYVVVTVTPKRIEKIFTTFITYHYFSKFYQVLSSWGLWLSTFSSALAALTRSQLPGMWRPWLGEFSKPRSWLPEVIYIYLYI